MNCLLLDTATEACSVAIQWQDQITGLFEVCPQQHSQRLLPMIDELVQQKNLRLSECDFLGFGQGPGSFTGVRIATGMLQGLAFGLNLPVVGVSTLAAMAQQAIQQSGAKDIYCAIDARMDEVYFAHYTEVNGLAMLQGNELVIPPAEAAKLIHSNTQTIGVGTGWAAYPALNVDAALNIDTAILYPDARYMLALARQYFLAGKAVDAALAEPVYLRDKVTWKKLPGR